MFLQRAPICFAGGDLNLYAYVWNDPVNWTDPSGLSVMGLATDQNRRAAEAEAVATVSAATIGLAGRLAMMIAAVATYDTLFNDASDPSENGTSTPSDSTSPATGNCDPLDPYECQPKPSECSGEPGYNLRVSSGDGRLGNSLNDIPLTTISPNDAYRLLQFFEVSVAARAREAKNLGAKLDRGHRDRLAREKEIRDRLKRKSQGHDC